MSRSTRILLGVVLAAAAMAAYWMLLMAPKREQITSLEAEIAVAETQLSQDQTLLTTYQAAEGAYERNYATVVRLGKAVPADDDVRSLMVQLDSAARRSGVEFTSIDVGAGSGGPTVAGDTGADAPPGAVSVGQAGFSAMPFNFAFTGSFPNLSGFFSRLERFVSVDNEQVAVTGRLIRVESIELSVEEGFRRLRASIGASSYLVDRAEGATGGATATGPADTVNASAAPGDPGAPPTTTATATGALR